MRVYHSTIQCPNCGKDSYVSIGEITESSTCLQCECKLLEVLEKENLKKEDT